jgi:hypothetical protein
MEEGQIPCPQCGEPNSPYRQYCKSCKKSLRAAVLEDVLLFPWVAVVPEWTASTYRGMAARSSFSRVLGLVLANGAAMILGLMILIGGNPYIGLAYDLGYIPFDFAWAFLMFVGFLVQTAAHYACFRFCGGTGTLLAHAYLSTLATANTVCLYWIAIIAANIFRSEAVLKVFLVVGGLYLMIPTIVSLKEAHGSSGVQAIAAFFLSVAFAVPLLIVYMRLFGFLREALPYEPNSWPLLAYFGIMLVLGAFIITYMLRERELARPCSWGVPVRETLQAVLGQRWLQILLAISLLCAAVVGVFLYVASR